MSDSNVDPSRQLAVAQRIDAICDRFELVWLSRQRPRLEDFLGLAPAPERELLTIELIALDAFYRREVGEYPQVADYLPYWTTRDTARLASLLAGVERKGPRSLGQAKSERTGADASPTENHPTATPSPPPRFLRYVGDYELLEEISRGGMGVIYRGRQLSLNRTVAVKMILSGAMATPEETERFRTEALAAAQLDHPHIVPVYEVGEHNGLPYFSMGYVAGPSLESVLKDRPLQPRAAAALVHTIAATVQYAHEQGVIHRDLKPSNVLLATPERTRDANEGTMDDPSWNRRPFVAVDPLYPKVTDFGLAKRVTDETGLTLSGQILGTPSYMPPEQAAGRTSSIGPAADVYALGAILYACLAGHPPFQAAGSLTILQQVLEQDPVPLRRLDASIPRDLETIALKCLEKSIARRYATAQALVDDLQRFLRGEPILARPASRIEHTWRWCCRNPWQTASAGLLAAMVVIAFTATWLLRRHAAATAERSKAESLVEQLLTAELREVPRLLQAIAPYRDQHSLQERFATELATAEPGSVRHFHAMLGLLPGQPEVAGEIAQTLLERDLDTLLLVQPLLHPYRAAVEPRLVPLLATTDHTAATRRRRLRAACLLAGFEPRVDTESGDNRGSMLAQQPATFWEQVSRELLAEITADPSQFSAAEELLRPARHQLQPHLSQVFQSADEQAPWRHGAVALLAAWWAEQADALVEWLLATDTATYSVLAGRLDAHRDRDRVVTLLRKTLAEPRADASKPESENQVGRQANAAATLLRLGMFDDVWPQLAHQADSRLRYLLSDQLAVLTEDAAPLVERAAMNLKTLVERTAIPPDSERWLFEPLASETRLLLLTLAARDADRLPADTRERLRSGLLALFEHHPDPGLHSVAQRLLHQWYDGAGQVEILDRLKAKEPTDTRDWWVNGRRQTFAVVRGPVEFWMGSGPEDPHREAGTSINPVTGAADPWDDEPRHRRRIERSFALATHELTLAELLECDPSFHERTNQTVSPSVDHPANRVTWFLAAQYCNWLSEREGLPPQEWCFEPNEQGKYASGMKLAPDYLSRTGYRLPTAAEWEYAARAGTITRRFFGEPPRLAGQYAWYEGVSREAFLLHPGSLRPNDLGLFDIYGNVLEWCLNPTAPGLRSKEGVILDGEGPLEVDRNQNRILRGGSLYARLDNIRAGEFWTFRPGDLEPMFGMRLARTVR